jgi:GNAT superfamily N-acetyltransferase
VTAARSPGFEVRPYLPDDQAAVVALLVSVFEGWPRQLPGGDPAAFFRWKHLESPFGPSVMVVAEAAGAVIGFEALLRWPIASDRMTLSSVRGADIAVDPAHRGRGVAGALVRAAAAEVAGEAALVFSSPNAMSDPMLVKLGRRPVGPFEVLVRPRRPLRLLRARSSVAASVAPAATAGPPAIAAETAPEALADTAALASLLARVPRTAGRFATALDPDSLRWRYGSVGDYRAIRVRHAGRLRGLAILRVVRRGPLWALAVCEVLAADDDAGVLRELLRQAPAVAPVDYAVSHFPRASAARRAAIRAGYVRSPRGPRLLVNPLAGDIDPDPTDTASWALSYGDLELI